MQEVCKFISEYWKLIVSGCLLIVAFIVALLRKKPINDILTYIYNASIEAVNVVEKEIDGPSDKKLSVAVTIVKNILSGMFPELDLSGLDDVIIRTIELILSTPQKKGD